MRDYADDCIHLHACRRMQRLYATRGKPKSTGPNYVARGCSKSCSAYQRAKRREVCTLGNAYEAARDAVRMTEAGYEMGDAIALQDFDAFFAYEIFNGENCTDEFAG